MQFQLTFLVSSPPVLHYCCCYDEKNISSLSHLSIYSTPSHLRDTSLHKHTLAVSELYVGTPDAAASEPKLLSPRAFTVDQRGVAGVFVHIRK